MFRFPLFKKAPSKRLRIVSFYGGDPYYYDCAERLKGFCEKFGLAHDIVELELDEEKETWADVCRKKIPFYLRMLKKHQEDIMWLDVDTELLKDPSELAVGNFDVGAFMRGFQYLPNYNPAVFARTLHPGYLVFKYSTATIQFLEDCCRLNDACDLVVTDDYILEETLRTSGARLRLMLFSPSDVAWKASGENSETAFFRHGDSGNVNEFKDKVSQHLPRVLEPKAQAVVLKAAIVDAAKKSRRLQVMALRSRLLDVYPEDVENYAALMRLLHDMGETERLRSVVQKGRQNKTLRPYALRFRMIQAFENKDWILGENFYTELKRTSNQRVIDFATSRRERFLLDRRAQELGVSEKDRVPLFWWEEPHPGNLGDIINPYVVEKLTNIPPKRAPAGVGMCAIGSVIKFAKAGVDVWGSGSPRQDDDLNPDAVYHAVRGPLTRDLVMKNGGHCPAVYGDPAWFLPILYDRHVETTHKTGLILHFTHEKEALRVDSALRRIAIRRVGYSEIENFIDEMRMCDRIVSTSLHGVIIAHAYGIPALLATVSSSKQQIHGDGIKFRDYLLSVGITDEVSPVDLSELDDISDNTLPSDLFTLPKNKIDLVALAKAAPFDIQPDILRAAEAFVDDA